MSLGVDPAKFKAYLKAEVGEKAADLETVSPGSQGERTDLGEGTSPNDCAKSEGASRGKKTNLRAILRSPEVVQDLYREGLIPQTVAAKLGPKSPTPEKAAQIAEARGKRHAAAIEAAREVREPIAGHGGDRRSEVPPNQPDKNEDCKVDSVAGWGNRSAYRIGRLRRDHPDVANRLLLPTILRGQSPPPGVDGESSR